MAHRIFSEVVNKIKVATDRTIGVIDSEGAIVACSDAEQLGAKLTELSRLLALSEEPLLNKGGKTAKKLEGSDEGYDYAVFVDGSDELSRSLCLMADVALSEAKLYYEEKHDIATFIKNIITDNILPGDIYIRAKELHFPTDQARTVFLVRQGGAGDAAAVDVLQGLFPDRQQDFVISTN